MPINIKTKIFNLKILSNTIKKWFLKIIIKEEKTSNKATQNLKSINSLKKIVKTKKNINTGIQKIFVFLTKSKSIFLQLKNWIVLIAIDVGKRRESVFINSYSKYKKKGVPKSKSPIPKIDWKIDKNIIDIISTVIFIKNIKYTKF